MLRSTPATGACLYTLLAATLILCLTSDLPAAPYTFTFEGVVTEVYDEYGVFDSSIVPDMAVVGSYTFNSDAIDLEPDPRKGIYGYEEAAPAGFTIEVTLGGEFFYQVSPGTIVVEDDHEGWTMDGYNPCGINDEGPVAWEIELALGCSLDTFSSDALPLVPPAFELGGFSVMYFGLETSQEGFVGGDITLLVPEPGTIGLLGIGAVGLLIRRRRG